MADDTIQAKLDENDMPEQGDSAKFGVKTGETCTDCISRQAAIDVIDLITWYHQNKSGEMVEGANSEEHQAWYKAEDVYKALNNLPSAQPTIEIVRCRECRWWDKKDDSPLGYCHAAKHCHYSRHWEIQIYRTYPADFFCADGERRSEDE